MDLALNPLWKRSKAFKLAYSHLLDFSWFTGNPVLNYDILSVKPLRNKDFEPHYIFVTLFSFSSVTLDKDAVEGMFKYRFYFTSAFALAYVLRNIFCHYKDHIVNILEFLFAKSELIMLIFTS